MEISYISNDFRLFLRFTEPLVKELLFEDDDVLELFEEDI